MRLVDVKRLGVRLVFAMLCAAMLSAVPMMAQDNGGAPGGPGHGRGGPGGPGRMGPPMGMLAKQLELTPDQMTQMKGIYADAGTQMKSLRGDTSLSQQDRRQKMFAIRQDTHTKFMALLTDDQKSKLETMQANMKAHRGQFGRGNGGPPPPPPSAQ
jgi:periplasmic protein CpxP/Spy